MDTNTLVVHGLGWFVVFVFSTCLHEAAHALTAWRLGDPTAYRAGQVTLNPVPHIRREPIGMVIAPILIFILTRGGFMIGWAHAPYDPRWATQHPRRAALMALAGPAANLLLVLISFAMLRYGLTTGYFDAPTHTSLSMTGLARAAEGTTASALATIISLFFSLNLLLLVFNLIPVPPLDGASIVPLFLPGRMIDGYTRFMYQSGLGMFGILVAWMMFPRLYQPVLGWFLVLLYG